MQPSNLTSPKASTSRLRCAIYTRKSTEEGLDQEFNSLEAQREARHACAPGVKECWESATSLAATTFPGEPLWLLRPVAPVK
jgi:hypothetical protein